MGQSGTPEYNGQARVNKPSSPKRVEVVMGRCFPLSCESLQASTTTTTVPVVKGVLYKDGLGNPATKPKKSLITIESRTRDSLAQGQTEMDEATISCYSSQSSVASSSKLDVQQNGFVHSSTVQSNIRNTSKTSEDKREVQLRNEREKFLDKAHPEGNPKRPILRRTQSTAAPEPEEARVSDTTKTPCFQSEDKQLQEASANDTSGRESWDTTQRKKALLREEFFRVPYEECNREAARSLGGRLNKSEPRLNAVGKERKKRNSLSYKRRVHFDLDDSDEEKEKNTKSNPKVHYFRTFDRRPREVTAPKKVVVSIYSIDDGVKRVRQCENQNQTSCNMTKEAPAPLVYSVNDQEAKDRNQPRLKTARPTDLDSLQQHNTVDKMPPQNPTSIGRFKIQTVRSESCTESVVNGDVNLKANVVGHPVQTTAHSLHTPPVQLSVRPRSSSAVRISTLNTPEPSVLQTRQKSLYHSAQSVPASTQSGPVASSRSHHPQLSRCQSYQGHPHEELSASPQPDDHKLLTISRPGYLEFTPTQMQVPTPSPSPMYTLVPPACTPSPPHTPSPTQAPTRTFSPTRTISSTHSASPTHTPKPTYTPSLTEALPLSPSPTHTPSPVHSPSRTHSPSLVHTPSQRQTFARAPVPVPRTRLSLSQQTSPSTSQSSTPHASQPSTPYASQPSTPHASQPSTPQASQPSTPHASQPSTPHASQPSTPYASQPSTPHASQPSTPHASQPSTPHTSPRFTPHTPSLHNTSQHNMRHESIHTLPDSVCPTTQQFSYNMSEPQTVNTSQSSRPTIHTTSQSSRPTIHTTSHPSTTPQPSMNTNPHLSSHTALQPSSHFTSQLSSHNTSQPSTHITLKPSTHFHRASTAQLSDTIKQHPALRNSPHPTQYTLQNPAYATSHNPYYRALLSSACIQKPTKYISSDHQENITKPTPQSIYDTNKVVYPQTLNKENKGKSSWKKTAFNERGNQVNILMTRGDSYSEHNIILNSHVTSTVPTVTVRKIALPASAPARCSPSPTPSCASSSCSFGSSGSSSGCYSGSPSPTPTPSPVRIRSSGVPTDL